MEGESVERPCCQLNVGTYGCLNPVSSCLKSLSWHLLWVWKSQYVIVQSCLIPMQIYIYIYYIIYIPSIYIYIYPQYIYIYTLNIYIYPQYIYIYLQYIYIYMYLYYDSYFFRARHISSPRSTKALRSSGDLSSRWKLSSPCKDCFLQRQAFECDVGETWSPNKNQTDRSKLRQSVL